MNNPTSTLGKIVNTTKRCVCVLALVLVFLAAGVGGMPSREARAHELPPVDAAVTSTAEVEVAPTELIVPTAATVSPEPNAAGWTSDKATATLQARFKTH